MYIPPRWGRQPPPKFSKKLHEIERIWTGEGARPKFYYVDPPLHVFAKILHVTFLLLNTRQYSIFLKILHDFLSYKRVFMPKKECIYTM